MGDDPARVRLVGLEIPGDRFHQYTRGAKCLATVRNNSEVAVLENLEVSAVTFETRGGGLNLEVGSLHGRPASVLPNVLAPGQEAVVELVVDADGARHGRFTMLIELAWTSTTRGKGSSILPVVFRVHQTPPGSLGTDALNQEYRWEGYGERNRGVAFWAVAGLVLASTATVVVQVLKGETGASGNLALVSIGIVVAVVAGLTGLYAIWVAPPRRRKRRIKREYERRQRGG